MVPFQFKVLDNRINTTRKKVRNKEEVERNLLHEFEAQYGVVESGCHSGGPRIFALRLEPQQQPAAVLRTGTGTGPPPSSHLTTYPLLD